MSMVDWDDIRYFLAVARGGSVRSAADRLGVNHSTVLRRIAQLEERLGAQLFEKLPSGYRITDAGEEVLELAENMETSSNRLESRVLGRDQSVQGPLRITLPPTLATHLLMPDFAEFALRHPEVEMEILSLDEPLNLTNREADIAIRVVHDRNNLPPNLHGRKGPDVVSGVYISRELLAIWLAGKHHRIRWIIKNSIGVSEWAKDIDIPVADVPFRTTSADAQIMALQQGLGMSILPCFVGDANPSFTRVPGSKLHLHGTLWILTQGETRKTKRVRLFSDFMARRLTEYAPHLAGERPQMEDARPFPVLTVNELL